MNMMSDFGNMDVLLGNENTNPRGIESANTVKGSIGNEGVEFDLHIRTKSSDRNEIRNFGHKGHPFRQDRILESMQKFQRKST